MHAGGAHLHGPDPAYFSVVDHPIACLDYFVLQRIRCLLLDDASHAKICNYNSFTEERILSRRGTLLFQNPFTGVLRDEMILNNRYMPWC